MKELNRFRQFLTEGDKDHKHTYKQIDPDGTAECTKCGLRNSDPSKTGEKVVKEDDKNDIKEEASKAKELSDRVLTVASEGIKDLNGTELMEFRALIAQAFDMKDEA